ncbi:hypothetical protein CONLIGDRAFT_110244 [Coniochaeta ligniaria NRRL 30616]|uniref:Uncharacterized protein n=1 Tax=Coniochaeta ligniaria NRRL 30616 TaxID=1408157 RepID=A0A1J7J1S0_9PEZI|nr:hypothetical protein CONLIGDRAFT_110244 [Coniochaeta ligniaria NRRL 30616]
MFYRHDQSLTASALNIDEVYSVVPSSPSAFVVDLVPHAPVRFMNDVRDTPIDELNLPTASSCSSNPSVALPLERYRRDSQRHERLAVSVALGRACDLAVANEAPVFWRSSAPSPSSGRGLELSIDHHGDNTRHGTVDDAITTQSVVDPDEHDAQSLLRTYSLERWFGSHMEKTQELAVELQQTAARPQRPMPVSHQVPKFTSGTRPTGGEADHNSPTQSSIILDPMEPDPTTETMKNKDTDESIEEFLLRNHKLLVPAPHLLLTATKPDHPCHRCVLTPRSLDISPAVPVTSTRAAPGTFMAATGTFVGERGRAKKTMHKAAQAGPRQRNRWISNLQWPSVGTSIECVKVAALFLWQVLLTVLACGVHVRAGAGSFFFSSGIDIEVHLIGICCHGGCLFPLCHSPTTCTLMPVLLWFRLRS